jgi:hypothetical protein
MEYRLSFNQRMLVWLGVAQVLLLLLCFGGGMLFEQYRAQPADPLSKPAARATARDNGAAVAPEERKTDGEPT